MDNDSALIAPAVADASMRDDQATRRRRRRRDDDMDDDERARPVALASHVEMGDDVVDPMLVVTATATAAIGNDATREPDELLLRAHVHSETNEFVSDPQNMALLETLFAGFADTTEQYRARRTEIENRQ